MAQTVLCLKWEDRYGPEYVNKLYAMVRRNTRRPLRFVCYTDDATGIRPEVEIKQMPPFNLPEVMRRHPFRRMFIWQQELDDLEGDVLHLDIDQIVTGNIDDFFDYRPDRSFCVAENWTQMGRGIGNMSVFRFRIGAHPYVWEKFIADPQAAFDTHGNSQNYVCRTISEITFWPTGWCLSFKHSLIPRWPLNFFKAPPLPPGARIVVFTGKPDPDEAALGHWPTEGKPWKAIYKQVRPTPWIDEHWR